MDLDHILHKVQGVFRSEETKGNVLRSCDKDSEERVFNVISSLKNTLKDEELDSKAKRKLYILLFINTDTECYGDLKKHRKYAHLVRFFPQLSKHLFTKIALSLQLHQHIYESVIHLPPPVSYQVLQMCVTALDWLDLFVAVDLVGNLLVSLFHLIHTLDHGHKYITQFNDLFQQLLLHYDAEKGGSIKKIERLKRAEKKRYAGCVLASLLSSVRDCSRLYCVNENASCELEFDVQIYHIPIEGSQTVPAGDFEQIETKNVILRKCYDCILSKCLSNVYSITIDLWMFWVEVGLDNIPDTENTLQRLIGENAFTCREVLKEAESFGIFSKESADLIEKLNNVAITPKTEEEQANLLDLEQILANIQDPSKDTKKWLRFLVSRPSSTFVENSTALDVVKDKISLFTECDLLKFMNILFEFMATHRNCTWQKIITLEMINALDINSKIQVSKCFLDKFGLTEVLKTNEFQSQLTEIFNKVVNDEVKENELYGQFFSLAMQSSQLVVERAVSEGITSEVRGHLMADLLGKLQPFCDSPSHNGNTLLISALQQLLLKLPDLHESQHHNYPLFVRELVMRKILDGEKYVTGCQMKIMHQYLNTQDYVVLFACLETLEELLNTHCEMHYPASVVMVMQAIEVVRWSPGTFKMAAVRVCELALHLAEILVSKLSQIEVEANQLYNLKQLMQRIISPMNRYHLSALMEEPLPADPGMQLVHRMHYGVGDWSVLQVQPEERNTLVKAMCHVLPLLTGQEWQEMFCVLTPQCTEFVRLFHLAADVLVLCLGSYREADENSPIISCIYYAVLNLGNVVKSELTRWTKDDVDHRLSVLPKLCQVIDMLPPSYRDSTASSLVKVLSQLLPEGNSGRPLSHEESNMVTATIASIESTHVRQMLAKTFLEMIHHTPDRI